uniref:Uncharacterized protein n=1 Tax=Capra hircus TaxID=9925 RepID=A0A452FRM9_CAPHI
MLEQAENELENGATWQNPEPPMELRVMEKDRANCPFYSKTGACRFGDRCSRKHNFPTSSPTLLIKSMFTTFGMEQCRRDDYDPDASLEYSEEETYQQFLDFYDDVLPEFKNVGKVIQFKVSCNLEPHLRGNVYVQYQSEEECQAALSLFNGRWYAGRQLQCEFCPVTRWKMVYLKYSSVPEGNTATSFTCSEIPTMSFGKRIETSTYLQIGLAPPLGRAQRGGRGWAPTTTTTAGRGGGGGGGGGGALGWPTPTRGTGRPTGRGGVVTGPRNLTNTGPEAGEGTVPEAEEEKGTAAADGAAGAIAAGAAARAPPGPGAEAGGGQGAETELFRAPNPNKLFFSDHTPYLLWRLHT